MASLQAHALAERFEIALEQDLGFEWLRDDVYASEDDRTFFEWEDREGGYWVLYAAHEDARLSGQHTDLATFRAVVRGFRDRV